MACNCGYRKRIRDAAAPFDAKRTVYMDYNATAPVDPAVLGDFDRVCRRLWANPSSLHSAGVQTDSEIANYTETILKYFAMESGRLYYCGSGTEALHAGIFGLGRIFSKSMHRGLISSVVEHGAVKKPLRMLKALSSSGKLPAKTTVSFLNVDNRGIIDLTQLESALKNIGPALLTYSPVNHETGSIQPVKTIYETAKKQDCLIFLDAVQACARLTPSEWAPYCDAFAVSGHKIYAPKGIAALYIKDGFKLTPFRFGGSQQDGIFPGTENTPGIASLARAFQLLDADFHGEQRRLQMLTAEGLSIIEKAGIDFQIESPGYNGSTAGGSGGSSVPGVICLSFPWINNMEEAMFEIDKRQVCVSRFSACSSRVSGASAILRAMGRPNKRCETSIRISIGRFSKREDFFRLAEALRSLK